MVGMLRTWWRRLTPGSSTVILHAHDEGDPCDSPAGRGPGDTPRCMTFRDARTFKREMADQERAERRTVRGVPARERRRGPRPDDAPTRQQA
jgi:hypothetical protein